MTFLLGETVQLGIGAETTRGTAVAPTAWIPARTPTGIVVVQDWVDVKEVKGTGVSLQGKEIAQTRAEGDIEFNVRNVTIGHILKSLLGTATPVTALGATTHTFTRLTGSAQFPALTLALQQPGQQSYEYAMGTVNQLEISSTQDDLVVATASFVAKSEAAHASYTPSYSSSDVYFRNQDVTVKFASTVAGLDAASAVCIKDLKLTLSNNVKPTQCLGSTSPTDVLTGPLEISGSFMTNFDGVANYYDLFRAGTTQAMRITMERDDLAVLGTSALYPKIEITISKIVMDKYTPDRKLDDIVSESIDFVGVYDTTSSSAISIVVQNTQATY